MAATINDRIKMLLHFYDLTPTKFAEKINVQRSGVSHILSGRNKPSIDFIQKLTLAFPKVDVKWLLHGTGRLSEDPGEKNKDEAKSDKSVTNVTDSEKSDVSKATANTKDIQKIVVFYTDHSFEEYFPRVDKRKE